MPYRRYRSNGPHRHAVTGLLVSMALFLSAPAGAITLQLELVTDGAAGRVVDGVPLPGAGNEGKLLTLDLETGGIGLVEVGQGAPTQVLPALEVTGNPEERRAISLALAPDVPGQASGFSETGHVYIGLIEDPEGSLRARTVVERLTLDPETLTPVPGSQVRIATYDYVPESQNGHRGGAVAFDASGHLYVTTGDGNNAFYEGSEDASQDVSTPMGALYRIKPTDPDTPDDAFPGDALNNYAVPADNPDWGPDAYPGLAAQGLRNPFKAKFDPETGKLFIGDVGQDRLEEINVYIPGETALVNYGWPRFEGSLDFDTVSPLPGEHRLPLYTYEHGTTLNNGFSVVGGVVNRGPDALLDGLYLFTDFGTSSIPLPDPQRLYGFDAALATVGEADVTPFALAPEGGELGRILSLVQDASGRLYLGDFDGRLFRVSGVVGQVPAPAGLLLLVSALAIGGAAAHGLGRRRRPARCGRRA